MNDIDPVSLSIFLFFFLLVTVLGFLAARWRKAETLDNLDEWGLGGRSFGTFIAWFLIGGDIYTAYTFIAVPALLYAGNATGFFAVPYTIILYPIIFIFLPRLWSVSHRRSYVTPADFVQGRFDSRGLSLAIAFTGILATLPYIALQLVGIQAVLDVMGLGGGEDAGWFRKDVPLFVAFALLAAYTYSSGLRAPALIAFVKDTLIYLVIIVAVIYLPTQLGGWSGIFDSAGKAFDSFNKDNADAIAGGEARPKGLIPGLGVSQWAYATLSLGSALALFMYPHSVTAVLSTKNRNIIRRNAALLPAYSFLLGLLALLGIAAVAAGIQVKNPQLAIPQLFEQEFSPWFAGVAFAAIVIGAFVPAAIMSIAAANLWTRNIYKAFINPGRDRCAGGQAEQARQPAREVRGAAVRAGTAQGLRDQPAAARRHLDPADAPGDRHRPLHPVVPPVRADRRLGGRHGLGHDRGLQHRGRGRPGVALRWLRRSARGVRHPPERQPHLLRADRADAQPDRGGCRYVHLSRTRHRRRHGRHAPDGLPGRCRGPGGRRPPRPAVDPARGLAVPEIWMLLHHAPLGCGAAASSNRCVSGSGR